MKKEKCQHSAHLKSDERFKAFFENSTEAVWCIEMEQPVDISLPEDEQIDLLYKHAYVAEANDAWARAAGYQKGHDLIGFRLNDILPRSNPSSTTTLKQVIRSGYNAVGIESEEIYPHNKIRYFINDIVGIIEDGRVLSTWGVGRNITAQKRAEARLRQAEQRYRTVADFTYDWESWERPDGSYEYVSPSFERITGYAAKQLMGRPELLLEIIVPDDRDLWRQHCHTMHDGQAAAQTQFRIQTKDGQLRWIEHFCQPVHNEEGDYLGVRANNRDITERMQMAEEMRRQLDQITALQKRIKAECIYLQEEIKSDHNFENIIGNSDALRYILYRVAEVAPTDAPVLIMGETGTGKELIARAIHNAGPRAKRPLVKLNCAALPATLIESELFGHAKGAFTGADARRIGRFQVADGATLFLDEITEIPLELQAKLLHVLQDGEMEPLGSSKTIRVDVRIIAASNRNLEEEVAQGRFRQDLMYRINVFPITIPPLRHRKEDIPLLVTWFVAKFNRKMGKNITTIPSSLIKHFQAYDWPGNIRELENVIERAVIISRNSTLKLTEKLSPAGQSMPRENSIKTLAEAERHHILFTLDNLQWKIEGKNGAARQLGLAPSTLRDRMKRLGISRSSRQ